jgi:hypothetical protein
MIALVAGREVTTECGGAASADGGERALLREG